MKPRIVQVPCIQKPVSASDGFAKKELSGYKLDLLGLCEFGCRYCSSNSGNYLRMRREPFARLTEEQLGERTTPLDDPSLMFVWPDVLENLRAQLDRSPEGWGREETLVFSMLTDGFSPWLIARGITEEALRLVLEKTAFRVRILTKNAVVGSGQWTGFFTRYPGRVVVGLSIGTVDDVWAGRMEIKASPPSARLRALRNLQDAGVPTYGMLCPVFPDAMEGKQLEFLLDKIRPDRLEHVWAEPYNDRVNWRLVRDSYPTDSFGYEWLTAVFEKREKAAWSRYATDLYCRLRAHAERNGWMSKLKFLLYEKDITEGDAEQFRGLQGVLLQSKPDADGYSRNPHMAALQHLGQDSRTKRSV